MKHVGLRAHNAAGARPGVLEEAESQVVAVTAHVAASVPLLATPALARRLWIPAR